MNFNSKARKRISFTPIMLTSKSIRPVDRSDYEIMRNQRKFSGAKKSRDDLTSYIFRNSSQFAASTTCGFQQTRQQGENIIGEPTEDHDDGNYTKLVRKMTTPTVVRMQFQDELIKNKRRLDFKLKDIRQGDEQQANQPQKSSKIIYFTNIKTFQQFTKMAKVRPHKRNIHILKDEVDQQWSKYLDKYYLNIRKVKPLFRKDEDHQQIASPKKNNVQQIQLISRQKNYESSDAVKTKGSNIRTHSKRQTRIERKQKSGVSPSQRDSPEQSSENVFNNSIYKKIQQDIMSHRSSGHKKDFFVFGMGQNNGKVAEIAVKNKYDFYRDFVFRINFTNGLYVKPRDQNDKPLKFFVGFGNNSAIIKGIMRRRHWWQIVDKISEDTSFVWTQLKISDFFKKQPRCLCKFRTNRYSSMSVYKDKEGESTAIEKSSQTNISNRNLMYGQDLRLWDKYLSKYEKYEEKGYDQGLSKRVGGLLKKKGVTYIQNTNKLKVHNHFQSNYFLGNKKALFYSMRKYYQLMNEDPYQRIPVTFHITQGIQDPQFERFLKQFQKQGEKRKIDKQFKNIWIIKPGEFTNRGRGITVCSTLDQIKNRLKSKERNANGTNRTFIVQKYIQRPLLYQKRKFDIRHYMVINCHNGKIKGYWYADGYIRTTSTQYSTKNTKDLFTHLTNDAVQKYGQDYGRFQKGNKVSYHQFQKYLTNHVNSDIDFQTQILAKMKEMATDTIRATYSMLDPERKQHNFQLFGLDFMVDQSLNVNLIQVNTNPCLETSCPLLTKIITPLVENVFKLCLDPLFPPPFQWPNQKKYCFGDNPFQQNKFTLVFDETQQGHQLRDLYKNTPRIDEKMGDIYQQDQQYQDQQKQWNDEEQAPGAKKAQ